LGVFDDFIGFIRGYRMFYRIFYKVIKIFSIVTYAEVHCLIKKVKGPKKYKLLMGLWGLSELTLFITFFVVRFRGAGGGEVSGGGTHYM
jgi:hypothetical protein